MSTPSEVHPCWGHPLRWLWSYDDESPLSTAISFPWTFRCCGCKPTCTRISRALTSMNVSKCHVCDRQSFICPRQRRHHSRKSRRHVTCMATEIELPSKFSKVSKHNQIAPVVFQDHWKQHCILQSKARISLCGLFNMQIKPTGDLVLCKVAEAEQKTTGGIMLPTQAQRRPTSGIICTACSGDGDGLGGRGRGRGGDIIRIKLFLTPNAQGFEWNHLLTHMSNPPQSTFSHICSVSAPARASW